MGRRPDTSTDPTQAQRCGVSKREREREGERGRERGGGREKGRERGGGNRLFLFGKVTGNRGG